MLEGWVELLSRYEFDWFLTLTFREHFHPERCDKTWRRFTNDLNRKLYGRRWAKKRGGGVYWVRADEWQKRGVLHYHALVGDTIDLNVTLRRLDWMDYWYSLAGQARIEAINRDEAVFRYLPKYVAKGGQMTVSSNLSSAKQRKMNLRP